MRTKLSTRRQFIVTSTGVSIALFTSCKTTETSVATTPSDAAATYYTNPGDSRAAAFVVGGQLVTFFGPKNEAGELQRISHATIDATDGDPAKQVAYDFAENGDLSQGTLGSGETMLFAWPREDRVIITYRSADGSQEARFPHDFAAPSTPASSSVTPTRTPLGSAACAAMLARAAQASFEHTAKVSSAETSATSTTGEVEVKCSDGARVSEARVTGELLTSPQTGTDVRSPILFTESVLPGLWEYPLPVGRAPNPGEDFHRTRFQRAVAAVCGLKTLGTLLAAGSAEAVCVSLLAIPAIGAVGTAACTAIVAAAGVLCLVRSLTNKAGTAIDLFSTEYFITITATHAKLGTKQIRFQVRSGDVVPRQAITFQGAAGIASLTTEPFDPPPDTGYTITATADCAGDGYTLSISIAGSDGYMDATNPPVALSSTVRQATLAVPGATQGVMDKFVATLTGPTTDTKNSSITF
jgi:hypothetical protein